MKLKEMYTVCSDTLEHFIHTMPNVPFVADDIYIEFTTKKTAVERFKILCGQFAPDRPINDSHEYALENITFANAIIGREKSAVLIKINYKLEKHNLRRIFFHELTHIYCGKTEIDGVHFIDVYGSGHTFDLDPVDKEYDGIINAGYRVWSEFIAEYYAEKMTGIYKYTFTDISDFVSELLEEIVIDNSESKVDFAMMSAYILNCTDIREVLNLDFDMGLVDCLRFLYDHVQSDRPWKITEEFIYELGCKYISFVVLNSVDLEQYEAN